MARCVRGIDAAADVVAHTSPWLATICQKPAPSSGMMPQVRALIGYPGQQSRPVADPDTTPEYVSNGMVRQVVNRGPIFWPTPRTT